MAKQYDKLWSQRRLNAGAIQRAKEQIELTGRALPCRVVKVTGAMVTVAFELDSSPWTLPQITIPKAESPWIRMPTQVGDLGITIPADTYIGNISGQSQGLPSIKVKPANLSALVFLPVSNANSAPIDQNAAQIQGPNGVISRTTTGTTSSVVTNTSGTTMTFGANTAVLDSTGFHITIGSYVVSITSAGMSINGIDFLTHYHYVPAAPGNSGGAL